MILTMWRLKAARGDGSSYVDSRTLVAPHLPLPSRRGPRIVTRHSLLKCWAASRLVVLHVATQPYRAFVGTVGGGGQAVSARGISGPLKRRGNVFVTADEHAGGPCFFVGPPNRCTRAKTDTHRAYPLPAFDRQPTVLRDLESVIPYRSK